MDSPIARTERTLVRFAVGSISLVLLLGFLFWGGSRLYRDSKERQSLAHAAAYLSAGDVEAASVSARRAYQLNPASLPAARMLATIDETAGERSALEWRRKAVQLAPDSAADQIAFAACALKFADVATAEKALSTIPEAAKSAAFHSVAAELAAARGKAAEALSQWTRAVQLDPQNKSYQVRRAVIGLIQPDVAAQAAARASLQELRSDPAQRAAATRALISDAVQKVKSDEALTLSRHLQAYPEATFQDALSYLDLLKQRQQPDFASYLTQVEKKSLARTDDLASFISWMNKSGLGRQALEFVQGLDQELVKRWPVPVAVAGSYLALGDWIGLEQWTKTGSWGSSEFLRHAYLARALRGQDKTVASEKEWNAAKKDVSARTRLVSVLARTAIEWRWTNEAADLLWILAKDPAERSEALSSLYRYYSDAGDTGGLYRTLVRLVEVMPEDLALQNNLAQVSLLLEADPERAHKMATALYQKEPTNPAYVSTYAFSLYADGNAAGAVKTMAALPEEQLREPAWAAYYGVFLAAAGQLEKSRDYLKLGASEARLLPEEKALLEKAQSKLPALEPDTVGKTP